MINDEKHAFHCSSVVGDSFNSDGQKRFKQVKYAFYVNFVYLLSRVFEYYENQNDLVKKIQTSCHILS